MNYAKEGGGGRKVVGGARGLDDQPLHPHEFEPNTPKLPRLAPPCTALLRAKREVHGACCYKNSAREACVTRTVAVAWRCSAASLE